MALGATNTDYEKGSYENDRDYNIKFFENRPLLFTGKPLKVETDEDNDPDTRTHPVIGYGYDLPSHWKNVQNDLNPYLEPGTNITDWQAEVLRSFKTGDPITNPYDDGKQHDVDPDLVGQVATLDDVLSEWSDIKLASEEKATELLHQSVAEYEAGLTAALGADDIPQSRERAAIISMIYNICGPSADSIEDEIPSTLKIIENNEGDPTQRAKLWYEIKFNTNAEADPGIQNRRDREAALFSLYKSGDSVSSLEEAKGMLYFLNKKREDIENFLADVGDDRSLETDLDPFLNGSKTMLIDEYADGGDIASVLVGTTTGYEDYDGNQLNVNDDISGTDEADLVLAQDGKDTVHGAAGNDYIYGGKGTDHLFGGENNDTLKGEDNSDALNGGAGSDSLSGGVLDDTLQGGAGNDILKGGAGRDELEGGAGSDSYSFSTDNFYPVNPSVDVIDDSDGSGTIKIDGVDFAVGERTSYNTWESVNGDFIITADLTLSSQTLAIKHKDTGSTILVKNWSNGELGINLSGDIPAPALTSLTDDNDLFGVNGIVGLNGFRANGSYEDYGVYAQFARYPDLKTRFEEPRIQENWIRKNWFERLSVTGGNSGDDAYAGLGGSDGLGGGAGSDTLKGGANNDLILGGSGDDRLYGGDGIDYIIDGSSEAHFEPWSDPDAVQDTIDQLGSAVESVGKGWYVYYEQLPGGGQAHTIETAGTTAVLDPNQSPSGNDFISGGEGADWIWAGEGDDNVLGGADNDFIEGGADDDVIRGGAGSDSIRGDLAGGTDSSFWHLPVSDTADKSGNDLIYAGTGDDNAAGGGGNDVIFGGDDNDTLYGNGFTETDDDPDADYVDGGVGADSIVGGAGNDQLLGGVGNDSIYGDSSDTTLWGDDTIHGGAGADYQIGSGGNDVLYGGGDADIIGGDATNLDASHHGKDLLYGGAGNDTMAGGGDDDTLFGGDNDDKILGDNDSSLVYAGYHGNDSVAGGKGNDTLFGNGGADTISGGEDADMLYGGAGKDQLLGGDENDYMEGDDAGLDVAQHGDDSLSGGVGNDTLFGNGGNDQLLGGSGNDSMEGDDVGLDVAQHGDDSLSGGVGNDTLFGNGGEDTLNGGDGDDYLEGGGSELEASQDGNDSLTGGTGSDTLFGDGGDDALTGGTGNDLLVGGAGDDTYHFESGFGSDHILSSADGDPGHDIISFGSSINADDLSYSLSRGDLIVENSSTGDSLRVGDFFGPGVSIDIHFADGSTLTQDDLRTQLDITGTPISGSGEIDGTDGEDSIYGLGSDDTIQASGGDDVVSSGAGDDALLGDAGNDVLYGDGGDDDLTGGSGVDSLVGGAGNDAYHFESGFGTDHISYSADGDSGHDVISFGSSIQADNLVYSATFDPIQSPVSGDDLLISDLSTGDMLTVQHYFDPDVSVDIQLANGDVLTKEDVEARLTVPVTVIDGSGNEIDGTEGDDRIYGDDGDNTVYGNTGDDFISAGGGNDTLVAGNGEDTLIGGAGDDTYKVGIGYTTIWGLDDSDAGNDTIKLEFNPENVINYSISGNDLAIFFDMGVGGTNSVELRGFLADTDNSHVIQFADGTQRTADFYTDTDTWNGTSGDDLHQGSDGANALYGGQGDDTLNGGMGNDSLYGDDGHDVLKGGNGDDRLEDDDADMYGGSGNDSYYVTHGIFTPSFPGFANPDIFENAGEGTDTMYTNVYGAALPDNVENLVAMPMNVVFGHGDEWTPRLMLGNDLDNSISVDDSSSFIPDETVYKLDGGAGADTLTGSRFDDIYVVDSPDDVVVEPDSGPDQSFDIVQASYSYHLDSVNNIEEVQLQGSDDISAWGTSAVDFLDGSTSSGANVLHGGAGGDRYIVDGNDVIDEEVDGGTDTVVFARSQSSTLNLSDYVNVENAKLGEDLLFSFGDGGSLYGDGKDNVLTGNRYDNDIHGNSGNDIIYGQDPSSSITDGNDRLYGNAGDDTIVADADSTDLYGGAGDDRLVGTHSGAEDFHYDAGQGTDTIDSSPGQALDRVVFGENVSEDEVTYSRDGTTLVVQVGTDPANQLRVLNYWSDASEGAALTGAVDQFVFANGAIHKGGLDHLPYVNNPPVANESSLQFDATEGREVSYQIPPGIFTDAPDDTLTLSLKDAPDWVNFDPETGVLSGIPPEDAEGAAFTVIATDSWGQTASAALTVNMYDVIQGTDADDHLTGTSSYEEIQGLGGNDVLDDGGNVARLIGGQGDDQYEVHNDATTVTENAGEGFDVVKAYSNATLSENVEKLVLVEGGDANHGTGNSADNAIVGNSSANVLDGGAGADTLTGGNGDDSFIVDNADDVVVEANGEGIDTVKSSVDYTLGETVENLTLLGAADLNGTGNAADNHLTGNDGDNRLDGGLGADTMHGGEGDDYYIVDSDGDRVDEFGGEGEDTVERRFETNRILSDQVENLILAEGVSAGNGNSLNNTITGNVVNNALSGRAGNDKLHGLAGDDTLFGSDGIDRLYGGDGNDYLDAGVGADTMTGGGGDDAYIVGSANDVLVENAGEGADQVQASASYTLSNHVENLFLMNGAGAIDGTGNEGDNYIRGNEDDNTLRGMGGGDTLVSGDGNDSVIGGTGDDQYVIQTDSGTDVVDNSDGGFDGIFFTDGVTRDRLSFARDGDDLLIFVDSAEQPAVRVTDHFLGGDAAIDYVQPDGGSYLTTAEINQIVADGGSGGEYDQVIEGTAGGEQLVGASGRDLVKGLAGADQLFGLAGDDKLLGGDGDDYLAGGNGSSAGSGDDRLEGGAGNDTLTGEDGANDLVGGIGDDKYVYGGGQDTVDNADGGFDGIFFNNGITVDDLGFTRDGDDLVIVVGGDQAQTIRVTNHFLGGDAAIDYVQPASGSMLDTEAINALVGDGSGDGGDPPDGGGDDDYDNVVNGTSAGEQLLGSNVRDLINGLGGNDTLFGFGADDKFVGGDGDDYLSGGNGSFSGSGNDILVGDAGVDTLVGEDGSDTLIGGAGGDKYLWQGNSGFDQIDDAGGGVDWVFFNGVDRERLSFHRDDDDLVILVDGDSGKGIRVQDHFLGGNAAIEYIQPGSGNAIPASQIDGLLTPMPDTAEQNGQALMATATLETPQYDSQVMPGLHRLIEAMASFNPSSGIIVEPQAMDDLMSGPGLIAGSSAMERRLQIEQRAYDHL